MANRDGSRSHHRVWFGFMLLSAALAVDFFLDVRQRDALSWMDPYQYYDFALAVLEGREPANGFEIPSIFSFFLLPALASSPSIPAGLWTNFGFTLLLLLSIHGLCRELSIETPSPIVAALALSSPLLIGLSRTLYVEYALSAIVAYAFLVWLRFVRSPDWLSGSKFAVAFGLGFMIKMTFPLFFALPVAAAAIDGIARRRPRQSLAIIGAASLPVVLVLGIQGSLFPGSFGYYLSLGNTNLAVMHLIGPPDWRSWSSVTFYFGEVGRTLLFLLTPFLFVAALVPWRRKGGARWREPANAVAMLWLWLLGPLLLLIVQPVKEPRHVAPCVVPAVLLVTLGIEGLPSRGLRSAAKGLALSLAALQFAAVTVFRIETPYFLDGRLDWEQVTTRMLASGEASNVDWASSEPARLLWNYRQNIAIAGFSANESLAWTWLFFPGVVFDLETFETPERLSAEIPYRRFEDLYLFTAFNTYNRRCGWRHYLQTLSRQLVVDNADFVIVKGDASGGASRDFPNHTLLASIERADGIIRVLRSRLPTTTPYRELYARSFLEWNPGLPESERLVVANELLFAAALGRDDQKIGQVLRAFPSLRNRTTEPRNIYWIAGYDAIGRAAAERIRTRSQR